jgi:hypothetical protein
MSFSHLSELYPEKWTKFMFNATNKKNLNSNHCFSTNLLLHIFKYILLIKLCIYNDIPSEWMPYEELK